MARGVSLVVNQSRSRSACVDFRINRACEDGLIEPEAYSYCPSGEGRLHDSVGLLGSPIYEVSTSWTIQDRSLSHESGMLDLGASIRLSGK